MLDVHVVNGTPGAATVLGSAFSTIAPGGDGQSVASVPVSPNARLRMWGGYSVAANTIGAIKLQSQDQPDPINGEWYVPGAASLLNIVLRYTNLKYKTGVRSLTMGTNTGVTAASAFLIDQYDDGKNCIDGRNQEMMVVPGITTFGGALTVGQWGSQAFAPSTALPNGRYAILGAFVSALSYGGLIRFRHADFGNRVPGFPVANYEIISTSSWDKIDKDPLLLTQAGYQFVHLSEELGTPCCPVFTVSNAGTGLVIEMNSQVADTPVVSLVLAKVG